MYQKIIKEQISNALNKSLHKTLNLVPVIILTTFPFTWNTFALCRLDPEHNSIFYYWVEEINVDHFKGANFTKTVHEFNCITGTILFL
jgi:hypothetical protein